jgi:hypothetical protein
MKKGFLLLAFSLLVSGGLFAQIRSGGTAWVASKSADIKSSTWFFAIRRGSLEMGSEVTVLQVKGNYAEVRSLGNSSLSGWTPESNLSGRRIVSAGTTSISDISLGGKGFSREAEAAYRNDSSLNFEDVDRTEAITVSQGDLYVFITAGRLNTGEQ